MPKAGSVFSITGGPWGHTGWIDAVDEANDTIWISDGNVGANQIRYKAEIKLSDWIATYGNTIYYAIPD